jgi:hypothetical protein
LAGTLSGLAIPVQRNLQLTPYLLGASKQDGNLSEGSPDHNGEFGIDLKYSLTPSLTIDATYNTDFAQVEVDTQQINLSRFNLFFPRSVRSSSRMPGSFRSASAARRGIFSRASIPTDSPSSEVRLQGRIASHQHRHHTHGRRISRHLRQQLQRHARAARAPNRPLSARCS